MQLPTRQAGRDRGRLILAVAAVALLCASVGCQSEDPAPRLIANPAPPAETPGAHLPAEVRPRNWTDSRGHGSCAIASSVHCLYWSGEDAEAQRWRRVFAGGQTARSLMAKWDAAGIPYHATTSADPAFARWVTDTRRAAVIWYFPSHAVNFVGSATDPDGRRVALLCDNNRPNEYLAIPWPTFLKRWREYHGFGLAPTLSPLPPLPWQPYRVAAGV